MAQETQQEILKEKWLKGVAITTTVLAVLTSIVSSRFNTCTSDTQLLTSQEAMSWQYYQAEAVHLQFIAVQQGLIRTEMATNSDPEQRASLFSRLKAYNEENFNTDTKKGKIEAEAKAVGAKRDRVARKGVYFMLSMVFFQIAIMLSSVSALVHRKILWITGLVLGCVAIFFALNGFFLFYDAPQAAILVHKP